MNATDLPDVRSGQRIWSQPARRWRNAFELLRAIANARGRGMTIEKKPSGWVFSVDDPSRRRAKGGGSAVSFAVVRNAGIDQDFVTVQTVVSKGVDGDGRPMYGPDGENFDALVWPHFVSDDFREYVQTGTIARRDSIIEIVTVEGERYAKPVPRIRPRPPTEGVQRGSCSDLVSGGAT